MINHYNAFMFSRLHSRRFLIRIFLALLFTGFIQVLLLGIFTGLFSARLIEETYSNQSEGRMELLVASANKTMTAFREASLRLSKNDHINRALFSDEKLNKEEMSLLYQNLYKEIAGRIDEASVHLVNESGRRIFSTHMIPPIYNPNSSEQSLTTYMKVKKSRKTFPVVDSFINPRGDRVALTLFRLIESDLPEKTQQGYIITDLNSKPLREALETINAGFFTDIYLLDTVNYKFVSLLREGVYGNFSGLGWQVPGQGKSGVTTSDGTLVAYNPLHPDDLTLAGTLRYGTVTSNLHFLSRMILSIAVIGLVLSSLMAYGLAKRMSQPVTLLVEAMNEMEKGNLAIQADYYKKDEFAILFMGFNDMARQIRSLMEARIEKEKALRIAERQALQSQINPHFLYNTLNTIKALSKLHGVDDITTIVTQLGKLMRNSIDSKQEYTTVEESLNLVEAYLQIQKMRFGSGFNWTITVEEKLYSLQIPRLIIQPLVENSVIHGLEQLMGERNITICGNADPPRLFIKDNGKGLDQSLMNEALEGKRGVGLYNVNRRLKLYYGENSGLSYSREEGLSVMTVHLGDSINEN